MKFDAVLSVLSAFCLVACLALTTQIDQECEEITSCTECLLQSNCRYFWCNNERRCVANNTDELTVIRYNCSNGVIPEPVTTCDSSSLVASNASNSSVPDGKTKVNNATSTSTPAGTSTTVVPSVTTTTITRKETSGTTQLPSSTPRHQKEVTTDIPANDIPTINRRFDGPSFIGGIFLAVGLMAIAYIGFKFYRARTERNYHTLHELVRESSYSTLSGH